MLDEGRRSGHVVRLVTSPRLPAGQLTRAAWQALDGAGQLWSRRVNHPLVAVLSRAGMPVSHPPEHASPAEVAGLLLDASGSGTVVWLESGDDRAFEAAVVEALPAEVEVEVVVGSVDPRGARLLDVVALMDRLRSPGGCPWDAEQTHESLAKYLVEETGEVLEAIAAGDLDNLREELGDVLLQVVFHARVASEAREQGEESSAAFDIDDVADVLAAKLVRRHPHVFADGTASTPDEVHAEWERIKACERAEAQPDD